MTQATTLFHDMRARAIAVYRVRTQASIYILGFHEERGRRFVVVRGEPGSDREHVIIRDSDPRLGEQSLFEVPPELWIGQSLEVATMTSSTITAVQRETDLAAIRAVGGEDASARSPWARPNEGVDASGAALPDPLPPGLPPNPRIMPGLGRGTSPAFEGQVPNAARDVVIGKRAPAGGPAAAPKQPDAPYPQRHVRYAEDAALLLRSIHRRDRIYDDVALDRPLKERLRRALDDCAELLEQIRRRDRR
ncbi:MAG TPA: hypothetical protein VGM88_25365 [Kofleriaceae bacterium]|jgi:hypothetical protein